MSKKYLGLSSPRQLGVLIPVLVTLVCTYGIANNERLAEKDGVDRTGNVVMLAAFMSSVVVAAIRIAPDLEDRFDD